MTTRQNAPPKQRISKPPAMVEPTPAGKPLVLHERLAEIVWRLRAWTTDQPPELGEIWPNIEDCYADLAAAIMSYVTAARQDTRSLADTDLRKRILVRLATVERHIEQIIRDTSDGKGLNARDLRTRGGNFAAMIDHDRFLVPLRAAAAECVVPLTALGDEARAAARSNGRTHEAFYMSSMKRLTGLGNTTINKYATRANVTRAAAGHQDHDFGRAGAIAILQAIIDTSTSNTTRETCRQSLAKIAF